MTLKRIQNYQKRQPIIECYPAVQGEGSRLGRPIIIVRTTGCTHRCYFGETGGWCDSWYTSIHAEKGRYSLDDVASIVESNSQIHELMITGGAPTMHPDLLNELSYLAKQYKLLVTMETEGSHHVEVKYPFALVSISPKLSNSIPVLDGKTPKQQQVTQGLIDIHNKYRLNLEVMKSLMQYHSDYQFKFVWDGEDNGVMGEIKALTTQLSVAADKIYLMPAGSNREAMLLTYPKVMQACVELGYNFTPRPHIIAFNDQREV